MYILLKFDKSGEEIMFTSGDRLTIRMLLW